MHCTSRSILSGLVSTAAQRTSTLPPTFLLPAFITTQTSTFSTTAPNAARKDGNPTRGRSAIRRRDGHGRHTLSVKLENLPKPVLDPAKRSKIEVDEDHGLWGFFNAERTCLMTPEEYHAHGRGWTVPELRVKSWDDLHRLWWLCVKEVNMINTYEGERKRLNAGYGEYEAGKRLHEVRLTMKSIKTVLTQRWYAWEDARVAAMEDEEVNLYADPDKGEPAYLRRQHEQRTQSAEDGSEPWNTAEDPYKAGFEQGRQARESSEARV